MKLALKKGAQSVSVYVFIQDSSKTTGEGLTGLAYNTTGLKCYYVRPKASAAQLSLKTQTVTGAHDAGGFKEVDATNMPGIYRLDLHNNILADGVDSALVMLHGADDMAPCPLEIQLTDFDLNSNAVVTNVATLEGRLTATRAGYLDKLNVTGTLANTNNASSFMANVASLALEATAQSIKAKTDNLPASPAGVGAAMTLTSAYDAAKTAASQASVNAIPTTPLLAASYTAPDNAGIAAIKAQTDNLPNSPAATGDAMTLTSAYDNAKDDVLTPLATVDGKADAIKAKTDKIPNTPAEAGEYTTALTDIQTDLDNPGQYKADVSGLAKTTDLSGLAKTSDLSGLAEKTDIPSDYAKATDLSGLAEKTDLSGLATSSALSTVDGKVDNIKAKTDNLPNSPAATGDAMTLTGAYDKAKDDVLTPLAAVDGKADAIKAKTDKIPNLPAEAGEYTSALTDIQTDLDNPSQYKADVSGLAKTTDLSGLAEKTDIPSDYAKANDLNGLAKTTDITALNNLSAAEMLNEVVVGTFTLREILTILAAKSDGYPATGGGTTTITYGGIDGTPGVIVETVDEDGNRSKVEFNL